MRSRRASLSRHGKLVSFGVIAAVLVIVLFIVRDIFLRGHAISCGDGARYAIDDRDFATRYSAYSLELKASVENRGEVSAKLKPVQLQQLSESLQSENEFRKAIVAGYNGCAMTKAQYAQYLVRFQALDSLAREINRLVGSPTFHEQEKARLDSLIGQYAQLAGKLGE